MSDNEEENDIEKSESDNEASINEEDLIEENKDYNSDVEESDSDNETGEKKEKEKVKSKPQPKLKPKEKTKQPDELDEDDVDEIDAEDDEIEIEIPPMLIEKAEKISEKFGIVIDPRILTSEAKPNPKIKREIVVEEKKYKTSELIQYYEFCELIGVRAQHISEGSPIFVDVESETTAREIAKKELQFGKCPYYIKRYMTPLNFDPVYIEIWNPNNMGIDPKFFDN